jgi:hypothetical protein
MTDDDLNAVRSIIQNGKRVDSVTHVIVANLTDRYGIFIDNTLNVSKSRGELPAV